MRECSRDRRSGSSQSHVDVRFVNVLSCLWNAQRRADWRRRAAAAAANRSLSAALVGKGASRLRANVSLVRCGRARERHKCGAQQVQKREARAKEAGAAPCGAALAFHDTSVSLSRSLSLASASAASPLLPSASALLDAPVNAHCRHKRSRFSLWLSHGDTMDYPLSIHFHQRPQVTRSSARVTLLSTVHTRTACNSCELKNVKC